jgi:AraC-like DNA-binding protein
MTWAHRIRLTTHDAVFAGQEAGLMRELFEAGKWPQAPNNHEPRPDLVSLREQVHLAQRIGIKDAEAIAASFGLADFGAAGAAVLASRDLHTAINLMNSFAPLLNLRHAVKLHIRENDVAMAFHDYVKDGQGIGDSLLCVDMTKMLRFLRDLIPTGHMQPRSEPWATHHLDAQPPCPKVLMRHAGITTCQDQILFPTALFAQRLPLASRAKSIAYQRDCRKMMRELAERTLCESVRRMLTQCTSPSVVQMATKLGMSTRTFRRRLASQRTTFLQILDEVRFQLAIRYLEDRQLTTELVAQKLGYSESANFRAAFRRWTGSSPRHFDVRSAAGARLKWQSPANEQVDTPCL